MSENVCLQPTAIRLGTSASSERERANKLSLGFDYGTTANNGNVLSQTIGREGMSGTLTQYYRYDGANRLGLASEGGTAPTGASGCPTAAAWRRDYAYGSRAVTGVRGHTLPAAAPSAVSAFSTMTNRMTAGSYDGAGNLTSLTGVGRLGYDAENRLKTYDNAVSSLQEQGTYFYDGLGQRVKRTTNIRGASETTVYVYDAFGQLAAEYSSKALAAGSGGRFFITQDHLGSTRLVTKQDKKFAECRDFFPFGERIASGQNGRSLGCYGGGAVKQQFTGKERDPESSLDYFGARYYSARLGRFTGVDPLLNSGRPNEPQSWNRYSYSFNNPLTFTDPTGLYVCAAGTGDKCTGFKTALEKARDALENSSLDRKSAEYKRLNAALQAYGDYDEENGVIVDFKKSEDFKKSNFAAVTDWNKKGDITVFFDPVKFQNQSHDGRAILVAHEGSHVSDISTLFGKGIQLTEYILEKRGYEVSSFAAEALGLPNWEVGGSIIWNAEWRSLDFNTLIKNRTAGINKFLKSEYGLSPEIQGSRVP